MGRLARLMDKQGISVQRMAELSGVNDRTVYRHYKSETRLTLEKAAAYARVLRQPIEALIEGDPS